MSELLSNAKTSIWEWRAAIFYFVLFSISSVGSCIMTALQGVEWETLDTQAKFLVILGITTNWCMIIMAFISKQANRIKQTGDVFPVGDTQFIPKPASTDAQQNKTP